jgi:GalNAc5-diNAcBac-PP-undecaprenol beta-1,3-glucosyltransferase
MKIPLISVIIPTHLRSQYLRRALESINRQYLRNDIEIIVISDAVDRLTDQVSNELLCVNDIYARRNGVNGPAASRNLGLAMARGHFVMFLDDDDAWHQDFTSELSAKLESISTNIIYMNCQVITETRPQSGPVELSKSTLNLAGKLDLNIFVKNQIHMSSYLFRRNILAGLSFDATLRAYEDWDFQLASVEIEMPTHFPLLCSCVYEVHDHTTDRRGSSTKATDSNALYDYLCIYRKHPAPNNEIQLLRRNLLSVAGLTVPYEML